MYETREIMSDEVFFVKEDMLNYRGKRYSLNDVALKWKKDCRMWLWKGKVSRKKSKSVGELRNRSQTATT